MTLPISKFKNIFILLGVLALLLVGLGVYQGMTSSKNKRNPTSFFGLNFDKITKIRILDANGLSENILEKKKNNWVVSNRNDFLANPKYIDDLKDLLNNLPKGDLASRDPAKQEEFQVDKAGVTLQAWEGDKQVADVVIGKEDSVMAGNYIKRAGADNIYLVPQNIRPLFNHDEWRDMRVWTFDVKKVTAVDWLFKGVEYSMIKTGDGWKMILPFSAPSDESKVIPIVAQLNNLSAADIASGITKEQAGLSGAKHDIRIELTFETGEKDALVIGNKLAGKEEYYAAHENSNLIFTLDSLTVEESLKKEIGNSDFFKHK